MTNKAKQTAFSESDRKSLKALYARYGAELIGAELNRIAEAPPVRAGAPAKIDPMSYVAVYLDIQERRVSKDGKPRRRALSLSKACQELADLLKADTTNVRYASKSLQAMYSKGLKLRNSDPAAPAVFIRLEPSSDGHPVRLPFISTEIMSDGQVLGPLIDRLDSGGRD